MAADFQPEVIRILPYTLPWLSSLHSMLLRVGSSLQEDKAVKVYLLIEIQQASYIPKSL